ncbi:unnamed protein product [Amaranthus hypochondriacus]
MEPEPGGTGTEPVQPGPWPSLVRTKAQNRIDTRIRIEWDLSCCDVRVKESNFIDSKASNFGLLDSTRCVSRNTVDGYNSSKIREVSNSIDIAFHNDIMGLVDSDNLDRNVAINSENIVGKECLVNNIEPGSRANYFSKTCVVHGVNQDTDLAPKNSVGTLFLDPVAEEMASKDFMHGVELNHMDHMIWSDPVVFRKLRQSGLCNATCSKVLSESMIDIPTKKTSR